MAYTDRHFRRLVRLYTQRTLLYTEMVVSGTILHHLGEPYLHDLLHVDELEHPIAVQLGGDDARDLGVCAKICTDFGYDEINLNVGCPSPKVQKGQFGVCMMGRPQRVAEIIDAMKQQSDLPVTVKHRTGFDVDDSFEFMAEFVERCRDAGAVTFIVHARKAWLKGLNPAQNRTVPPLQYDRVYQLKKAYPELEIIINGGIQDLDQAKQHLQHVDGVMIGRAAYHSPELFADADHRFFGDEKRPLPDASETLAQVDRYLSEVTAQGVRPSAVLKHCLGLFKGRRGSRQWRRTITEHMQSSKAQPSLASIYKATVGQQP